MTTIKKVSDGDTLSEGYLNSIGNSINSIQVDKESANRAVLELESYQKNSSLYTQNANLLSNAVKTAENTIYNSGVVNSANYLKGYIEHHASLLEAISPNTLPTIEEDDSIEFYFLTNPGKDIAGNCTFIHGSFGWGLIDCGVGIYPDIIANFIKEKKIDKIKFIIITHYHSDHTSSANWSSTENKYLDAFCRLKKVSKEKFKNCIFFLPHQYKKIEDSIASHIVSHQDGEYNGQYLISQASQIQEWIQEVGGRVSEGSGEDYIYQLSGSCNLHFFNNTEKKLDTYCTYEGNINNWGTSMTEDQQYEYNDFSLITVITWHDKAFLFPGDLEYRGQEQNIDALKYGCNLILLNHHNSIAMTELNWASRIRPEYAIRCTFHSSSYSTLKNIKDKAYDPQAAVYASNGSVYIDDVNCEDIAIQFNKNNNSRIITGKPVFPYYTNSLYTGQLLILKTAPADITTIDEKNGTKATKINLNYLNYPGVYYTSSSSQNADILNLPSNYNASYPFTLIVETNMYAWMICQTLIVTWNNEYIEYKRGKLRDVSNDISKDKWSIWKKVG